MKHIGLHIYFIFALATCKSVNYKQLNLALQLARGNRPELEKVLNHYKTEPQKLAAAQFLIENMPGKYSIDTTSSYVKYNQIYYNEIESFTQQRGKYTRRDLENIFDSIKHIYPHKQTKLPNLLMDLETISSDFLIEHIDFAFDKWESSHWNESVDFDTFCKYILPYKSGDSYWEDADAFLYEKYKDNVSANKSYTNAAKCVLEETESDFMDDWRFFNYQFPFLYPTHFSNTAKYRIGLCPERSHFQITVLRSLGIPAVLNTTPSWGNSDDRHFWPEIIGKNVKQKYNNIQIDYHSSDDILLDGMFLTNKNIPSYKGIPPYININKNRTFPKIYRDGYSIQKGNLIFMTKEEIPPFFKNMHLEDITGKYVECADISIPVQKNKYKREILYLCTYNKGFWVPVCWSVINNGKARFGQVGKSILYMPAFYDSKGVTPYGYPFLLTEEGEMHKLIPSKGNNNQTEAVFYSKFPYRTSLIYRANLLIGGTFHVANRPDFSDSITVHTIEKITRYEGAINLPSDLKPQRYVYFNIPFYKELYDKPFEENVCMAEIQVWGINNEGQEVLLQGKTIGNRGLSNDPLSKISDGDRLSFFHYDPSDKHHYIGLDLGKPHTITRIHFMPRNDDNRIITGEYYELFYWEDNQWISLGKQTGIDGKLKYTNIPTNALFRIHNHTRGKEHRPFTYENDKQVWW